jgi:hypothetical protein
MKQRRDGFDTTKLGGSPARHLEMAYRHHLFLDLDPSSSTLLGRTHTQAFKENEEEKTTIRRNTQQGGRHGRARHVQLRSARQQHGIIL